MSIGFFETLCRLCKHRTGLGCAAFPKRIPLEIRLMHVDHREPYPGDDGIQFEPKDDSPRTRERLAKVKLRKPITRTASALRDAHAEAVEGQPADDQQENPRAEKATKTPPGLAPGGGVR